MIPVRNNKGISEVIFTLITICLINSCTEKTTPPTVSTIPVSAISYTSAVSGGAVTYEGGATVTGRGVCWSNISDPTITNSRTSESGGFGAFQSNITQLAANTQYYVRAYATNMAGTGYGNQMTFTTRQSMTPALTTAEASSITQTTAVSGGNITDDNGGSITVRGVCWSTTANPEVELCMKTEDGTGIGVFSSNLTELDPNTLYYLRAYATSSTGTGYGNQVTFTSSPLASAVLTTTEVKSITESTAISGGNISYEGGKVSARGICWDTAPWPTTSLTTITSDGSGAGAFESSITGLTAGTLYYVRAYAINELGTSYGNQVIFFLSSGGQAGTVYNGHFYYSSYKNMSWADANTYCDSFGGHLVIINDEAENTFVWNFCNHVSFALGLSDIEQEQAWKWVDGTSCRTLSWNFAQCGDIIVWGDPLCTTISDTGYNNWSSGEPNSCGGLDMYGHCTVDESYAVFEDDGTWNDVPGFGKFIIEWEFIPDDNILNRLLSE
jgi:hypothetical protein